MKKRPRVLLVALGGSISAAPDERGHGVPARAATEILASLPDADGIAEIVPADVKQVPSRAVTPADMCALAHEIQDGMWEGYDGIVVTHGTDTMEETAYALALQLDVNVPVVLTGAMRFSHEPGADGPGNLLQALRVATTPAAGRLGPVVVMHDEVHLARWVTKVHTSRVSAFSSPGFGPVGCVVEGRVCLHAFDHGRDHLGMPDTLEERVELVWVSAGADGLLVDAASSVAQGVVVAGTGGGHVPPAMTDSLRAAIERGLPVVLASRCSSGRVLEGTYGGDGSETHLRALGLHPAGALAPIKARLRLMVALALGKSVGEVFPV
jgi:L-asparaginase